MSILFFHPQKANASGVDTRTKQSRLRQIEEKNYRNPESLPNIRTREYGIAGFHLSSYVKARFSELNGQNQWVEKNDPMMSVS